MQAATPNSADWQAMGTALAQARAAEGHGDVPIGAAILTADGELLAQAGNERERRRAPTAHADRTAVEGALKTGGYPAFLTALRQAPVVGAVTFADQKWPIRWARERASDLVGVRVRVVRLFPRQLHALPHRKREHVSPPLHERERSADYGCVGYEAVAS